MPLGNGTRIFVLSADPAVRGIIEPLLQPSSAQIQQLADTQQMLSLEAAPTLILLDTALPGLDAHAFLRSMRAQMHFRETPIVLVTDTITREGAEILMEGLASDLILRSAPLAYWKLRLELALNLRRSAATATSACCEPQTAPTPAVLPRADMLALLFRETDRAQRLRTPLSLILFAIEPSPFGPIVYEELLQNALTRTARTLRSYDAIGRMAGHEFLILLPGCSSCDAVIMAERLRASIFCAPFPTAGLIASYGVAESLGRSPVVVLREAAQALQQATLLETASSPGLDELDGEVFAPIPGNPLRQDCEWTTG